MQSSHTAAAGCSISRQIERLQRLFVIALSDDKQSLQPFYLSTDAAAAFISSV